MAATGFTPIQLYRTSTASATPTAGNLADGELAINTTDEKLYFKNASGVVKLLAANITPIANGGTGTTSTQFVNLAANVTGLLPVANGGTGTATPALVQGTGVTITGSWPNQTINATGTGGTVTSVAGTGSANGLSLSGTVTSTGNITLGGAVTSLTTTNFTIEESGGNLVFKYGATVIASMDSSGNLITLANVTAYGTP